ncbi:unnamed protein product, partial [Rotaria sp. Silwood1]
TENAAVYHLSTILNADGSSRKVQWNFESGSTIYYLQTFN